MKKTYDDVLSDAVSLHATLKDAIGIIRGYESATFWQRLRHLFTGEI